jgi:mRNA interferase MazF
MEALRRGDIVTAALPGASGKPRPALVVQNDAFAALPSVTVLPLTGDLQDASLIRVSVEPDPSNGLRRASEVMVDKAVTLPRSKTGRRIGWIDSTVMRAVDSALGRFLGLA